MRQTEHQQAIGPVGRKQRGQFAIEADDAKEGRRLFDSMSAEFQSMISGDAKNAMLMAWLASGAEQETIN